MPCIPKNIIDKYIKNVSLDALLSIIENAESPEAVKDCLREDMDVDVFLDNFDEPINSVVLEVGSHDEPVANILADAGYKVIGVDLRHYDKNLPNCNYEFIQSDFNSLPNEFIKINLGNIDSIFSLSAIEHFGLGTYLEHYHAYYDVLATRQMWNLLKVGGTAYITVPFGNKFIEFVPHWRIYDMKSLQERVIQDFQVEEMLFFFSGETDFDGKLATTGQVVTKEEAMQYSGRLPHLTVFLKLRKISISRFSSL